MLQVERLDSRYGRIPALSSVSLDVGDGELVALVGANGAGKSTLLRAISGVQPVTAGAIRFDGQDLAPMHARKRVQLGIVQVPEGRQVFGPLSVEDNLKLGAFARGARDGLAKIFSLFPALADKRCELAGNLSGGQQQMLAMGRALMAEPRLLLLDEPSLGLAPNIVDQIFDLIVALNRDGMTILLVEQNAEAALDISHQAVVLRAGNIAARDSSEALLHHDDLKGLYFGV